MPKKKLTKAQVKRKLKTCTTALYDLTVDKYGHGDSAVPMSFTKLIETHKAVMNALKRTK